MMTGRLLAAGVLILLAGELAAQQRIDPSRLHPIRRPPRHAGTVDVTTGKWTKPSHAATTQKAGALQTIYKNNCTWAGGGYYAQFESCEWNFDEGRVPSTSDPNAPSGAQDAQAIQEFQVSYCTYVPTSSLPTGYEMELAFYDKNNGNCAGAIPQQPPPVSTQATAYFDLSGLGLPGSTGSGFQACWIVTVDVSNSGWVMASDGEGTFDNDPANDKFIWAQAQNSATSPFAGYPTPDGFILAGEPNTPPGYGSCSYNIPCGTDAIFGNTCGTGLDTWDGSWINVDGVPVGPIPPPTINNDGVTPTSGGEGTLLTVNGAGFGNQPLDLKVLLASGLGFADVQSATGNQLTAVVYAVGTTGSGPITVIRGTGSSLPNQGSNVAGISSNATQLRMILGGAGANSAQSYTLSPPSNNTVSAKTGNPMPGTISLPMAGLSGGDMSFRLSFKVGSTFRSFEGTIDFTGIPTTTQMAEHLADHMNKSFGPQGVAASASGTTVRISMAGATYGGIVVKGQ